MKKNLLLKRILSAVLTIVLLASAIPVSLAVQELFTEELPAQIVREVPELREESVKHFLCDDGSYIAATYAEPVHYNENGVWKEIDNRLILNSNKLSASGEPTYTTRAGLAVSIPQNFADGQKITAENKGYEISFGIKADQAGVAIGRGASVVAVDELMSNAGAQVSAAPQSVSSVVVDAELTADVIEERNAELMVVENQAGAVQYRNILPSTNLEYAVTSSSVKESIVVREPQSEYKYYFDMDLDGLTPVENNDGSISLTESGDTASEIFWIEAPYMYDANSDESFAVTMSLTEVEGKYVLAVEADKDWINAADRAFPVVIDPTLHLSGTYIDDAFVISGLQMNSLRRGKELRVGRNLTNLTRTYMKIKMPVNISAQSVIQEATLKLKKTSYFQALGQSNVNINVYDFKSNSWSFDSLEWNSQPYGNGDNAFRSHGDDLLDSVPANKQTETYSFNILNAVKRWIATGDNRGIALVSSEETSKAQVDLHSSRVSTSSDRPSLTIKYSLPGIGRVSLMLDQTAQTSQSIEVACNGAWTATTDSSWITVSPSSGSGLSSIRITVPKNHSIDPRTGNVTVKTRSTVLGVLRVTQAGSKLMLDTNAVTAYYNETNAVINVSSAEDWTVETPNWIVATPSSGSGNTAVTVRILENEGNGIRDDRIRFSTASDSEEVAVTQLDRVSSCFNNIDSYGNVTAVTASDYNHRLATWAMELSYAAYNYPNGEELPIIPGAFMGDFTKTAGMLLEDNGFVNVVNYKYETSDSGAHTIGCGSVEFLGTSNLQSNNIGGNYNVHQHNGTNIQLPVRDLCDSVCAYECNTRRSNSGNPEIMDGNVDVLEVSESQLTTTTVKNLVVIDVRGSVTLSDWGNDIVTQLAANNNRFEALADEVFTNAIRYMNAAGVLGLNPIVLITGHSMGAAIANILAARFNEAMDPDNIYAYTFATPRTVNEAVSGNQAVNYPNIFNILNSNDAVTYVPSSFFSIEEHWRRHGIDLYINMPYSESNDTDLSGMLCHAMPVYLNWLNSSEDLSLQEMLTLSEEARVRGLLPIIVKIKCPVGVTIKDSNGNIIGYESQQENAVYPDMLNRGVVSWIEEDGAKMFFIPSIADAASIEIEAYDYGSMNFTVGSVDASTESEIKTLNNISLYPGKEFIADISEDVPVEDTQLFITENGETVGEVTETNPHLKGVEVWHEVKTDNVVTRHSFIVDDTVTEIRLRDEQGGTYFLKPNSSWVTIVEDGDNFRWTGGMSYIKAGDFVYDVLVNSNGEWYTYENALYVHVPQEYADMNKEFLSPKSTTTNTATVPAAVPYYTVIDPTDN